MFDIGFSELLLIGVVALLVLGPERLPRAARMAGLWMRRARASWYSVRSEFERELADEDLRRSIKQGAEQAKSLQHELGDTARSLRAELGSVVGVDQSQDPADLAKNAALASKPVTPDGSQADATFDPAAQGTDTAAPAESAR